MLLNWTNENARNNALYRAIRRYFPQTFGVIESIKRRDHKNIAKQTQHYTAEVIRLRCWNYRSAASLLCRTWIASSAPPMRRRLPAW
jgi:hypothetical protein